MLTIDIDGVIIRLHKETSNPPPTFDEHVAAGELVPFPKIGEFWPFGGGIYAGMRRATDEHAKDYHLVLVEGAAQKGKWGHAAKWAETVGHSLPTLRELALLRANLPEHFSPEPYWSSEADETNSSFAWYQDFGNGAQFAYRHDIEIHARAIRRVSM